VAVSPADVFLHLREEFAVAVQASGAIVPQDTLRHAAESVLDFLNVSGSPPVD